MVEPPLAHLPETESLAQGGTLGVQEKLMLPYAMRYQTMVGGDTLHEVW